MADDIMEISSENGLHLDEDVDFDFELTAPAGDEDAILEDADNTELENHFHPQPSPGRGHDDLMIDDEDHTTFTMVDADLIHDETEHTFEHETMSFVSADASHFEEINVTTYYEGGDEVPTDIIDHGQQSSIIDYAVSSPVYEQEHVQDEVQDSGTNIENFEGADEETTKASLDETSEKPATPVEPPSHAEVQEPQSPPTTTPEPDTSGLPTLSDKPDQDQQSVTSTADHPEVQATTVDAEGSGMSTNEVIVLYQSNEYALFSTSELDDPDSFFLSDRIIAQKPLSELFQAIRGIIHEDLNDEDELCISFSHLNLDVEEVSSTLQDVNLDQIMALYEKLLTNDGLEITPLRIELSVRKSFWKRIEILTTGANEGKGISEFVSWSENSGSVEDSEERPTNNNEDEVSGKNQPLDNLFTNEGHKTEDNDHVVTKSNIQLESEQEQEEEEEEEEEEEDEKEGDKEENHDATEALSANEISYDTKASTPSPVPDSRAQETAQLESKISLKPESIPSPELDEDGDIIDYSEDELDNADPKSRGLGRSALTSADASRTDNVAEYATFNAREDLRRRSSSHLAEEQTTELTAANTDGQNVEHEETGDYDEYNDEYDEQADFNGDHQDITTAGQSDEGSQSHPKSPNHADGVDFEDNIHLVETHQELVQQEAFDDVAGFTEYFGDETDEAGHEETHHATEEESEGRDTSLNESWNEMSANKAAGLAEPAESSGTVSADEINFDEGQEEVFHDPPTNDDGQSSWDLNDSANTDFKNATGEADEIDYEDEDEEPAQELTEVHAIATPSQESSPTNGKRSRAESDLDDTLEKDAKRPRP